MPKLLYRIVSLIFTKAAAVTAVYAKHQQTTLFMHSQISLCCGHLKNTREKVRIMEFLVRLLIIVEIGSIGVAEQGNEE